MLCVRPRPTACRTCGARGLPLTQHVTCCALHSTRISCTCGSVFSERRGPEYCPAGLIECEVSARLWFCWIEREMSARLTTTSLSLCAYVSLPGRHANALKLHHTKFSGRVINVELTVGGGGNSENRAAKLKEKNRIHLGTGGPDSINSMPLGKRIVPPKRVDMGTKGTARATADSSDDDT